MMNIHNLSVSFQGDDLFKDITFKLSPGDRVGLIGKNGAGKSTMLKLLSKEMAPDTGQIATSKDLRIGFLKQDIDFIPGRTVLEEAYEAFSEIKTLEAKISATNTQLLERTDYESEGYLQIMVDISEFQHQYDILGGYSYQGNTEKILQGLGFERADFTKHTDTFSGGWRMRIELAKLLLQNHDVLLLDEPTNHLDITSIIWLEGFLNSYSGAVVVVSHDKMFLDGVTNRTIEISLGRIYDYSKPYSKYLALRETLKAQQLASQKNQQKQIEHTEKLIEKFRAKASKATMAQSLIKKLDRMERIEVDDDDSSVMALAFPVSVTPGKVVLRAENVSKHYGSKCVLKDVDLLVERGHKIAFVGQNGQGKSTLAKIIAGEIPHNGDLTIGHNVQIGYFAQNQAEYLDGNKTVLETMVEAANETNRHKVRDILGAFLFRGDAVHKYVRVLSGGERNRLALAKLMLQPSNVLVMDEPTNHLDIRSKQVLKDALKAFEGTLILVSHDRDFLQGLTHVVHEFKDHKLKTYLGAIDYYLEQRSAETFRDVEKKTEVKALPKQEVKAPDYSQKKLRPLMHRLRQVEARITDLECEIKKSDETLEALDGGGVSDPDFFIAYEKTKTDLQRLMTEWEAIQMELEATAKQ